MSPRDLDAWMERQREDAASVDQCVGCGDPWDTAPASEAVAERLDCAKGAPVCGRCRAGLVPTRASEPFDPECPL